MYLFCDSFTAEFEQGSYRDCLSTPLAISAAGAHSPPRQPAAGSRRAEAGRATYWEGVALILC
jgi:hypothetical protein